MLTFVLLAAVLTVAGITVVAIPLLRRGAAAPAHWAAFAAALLLVAGAAALYALWSNWQWRGATAADTPQSMVAHLARQLEHDPNNLDGWLMLGRSYVVLQEYPLALRAYERAARLSGGKNGEALLGEAETLVLSDETELDGRAGRLIEEALVLMPDSGKALLFGAAAAARRGDLPLARQRFQKLLAMNPPQSVRELLEHEISDIDAKLLAAQAAPAAGTAPSAQVRVQVSVAPALAADVGSAQLFVFVRAPGQGGPPLAVKRLASSFPQTVALSATDSMIPGHGISAGQSVQVVARIARSGNPVGASGDPYGEVTYRVGTDGLVNLVIDRLTP
jgi:cytochrome c-type biogenesis protein CcmH